MEKDSEYLPRLFDDKCFGCGDNPHGLRMKFKAGKKSVFSELKIPEHLCGWEKYAHGGVISTVLDEVMSWTALYFIRKMIMTKKMTVEFLKPVAIESLIRAEGRIIEKIGQREVLMEGTLYDEKGIKLAQSSAVFAVFSPAVGRRLGIVDYDCADRFERYS